MQLVYTVQHKGATHAADMIHLDTKEVWSLCGLKFLEPSLELNFTTCDECLERLNAFGEMGAT